MQQNNELDIQKYLDILDRYKWHGLIPAIALMTFLTVASLFLPKVYESECVVEVETGTIENPLSSSRERLPSLGDHVSDFSEMALSWSNLSGVIDEVGADAIVENSDIYNLRKIKNKLLRREKAEEEPARHPAEIEAVADILKKAIKFRQRPPRFLTLSYRGVNSTVNAKVLNTLVSKLIEDRMALEISRAGQSYEFLKTETETYKNKLEEAEANLKEFKENNITKLPSDMNLNLAELTKDKSKLHSLELKLNGEKLKIEFIEEQMQGHEEIVVSSTTSKANPSLEVLNSRIVNMEIELQELLTNYTELHPRVSELREQLEKMKIKRDGLSALIVKSQTSTPNPVYVKLAEAKEKTLINMEVLRNNITELEERIKKNEMTVRGMPSQEQELLRLTRNYDVTANIYSMFLKKLEEVRLQEKLAMNEKNKQSFRVFEYARPTTIPVAPNKIRIIALIILLGAGTSIGTILLFDFLDDSVTTAQEVKEFLGKPMLGSLPGFHNVNGNGSLVKWTNKSSKETRQS